MSRVYAIMFAYLTFNVAAMAYLTRALFGNAMELWELAPIASSVLIVYIPYRAAKRLRKLDLECETVMREVRVLTQNTQAATESAASTGDIDPDHLREMLGVDNFKKRGVVRRFYNDILHMYDHGAAQPIYLVVDWYSRKFSTEIMDIAQLKSIALYLGILFTFVGMTMAILSLDVGPVSSVGSADLLSVVSGLKVAFISSISGLIAALCIVAMVARFPQKIAALCEGLETLVRELFGMLKSLELSPSVIGSLGEIAAELRVAKSEMSSGNSRTAELVVKIEEGMGRLTQAKTDFEALIEGLHESERKLLDRMSESFDMFSPEKIAAHLSDSVKSSVDRYGTELESTRQTFGEMNGAARNLTAAVQFVDKRIEDMAARSDEAASSITENMDEMLETLDRVTDAAEDIADFHPVQTRLRRVRDWVFRRDA